MKCNEKMKAIVYIDQNNIFFRYKKLDFKLLKSWLEKEYDISRITSFTSIDHKNEAQTKFCTYLVNQGYRVEDPDVSVMSNVDPIIITSMCNDAQVFDHNVIVLIACDGGYSYPLNELAKKGFKIHIIGVRENTSIDLLKIADKVEYLENIKGVILS